MSCFQMRNPHYNQQALVHLSERRTSWSETSCVTLRRDVKPGQGQL
jgi:hypothetical protein